MASLVSYRAERCANTEALERHEDEIDEVEAERERFEKEVEEAIFEELEELKFRYDLIKSEYGYDELEDEFRNYVKEVL